MAWKCNAVEDLFYSSKNKIAVEEEMLQINDLFELLLLLLDAMTCWEKKIKLKATVDMVDEQIFTFKGKVHKWLKRAE